MMEEMKRAIVVIVIALAVILGFVFWRTPTSTTDITNSMEPFKLKTSAFREGEKIPVKYTCDGDDVNPLLEIRNVPAHTLSLALIMDDPDASRGTPWDHWLMWNIDPATQYISEDNIPNDAVQGMNSGGKPKYAGPCPPKGKPAHHYVFTLYALDAKLALPAGSTKEELLRAMETHILAHTSIVGLYNRE